ncbi:DNA-binding protein [Tranquillimonas alkanivorans]|uniref:Replication region DNA-binding N-term n=1 Tax=Tranquillimonas alkanivorans TaxID=441119 RepID=A0A1I5PAT1_9RHOB|nr:DNA-binding protein [Tranquillimonas alkanivorans]SFP31212.1 replication region DNA-binding N-term [Tranquillimonas alkanivorans]
MAKPTPKALDPRYHAKIAEAVKTIRAEKAEKGLKKTEATTTEVHEKVKGSWRDFGPAFALVMERLRQEEALATQVPEMPEEVADMANRLWQLAYRSSDAAAAEARHAHAAKEQDLRDENVQLTEALVKLEDERDTALEIAEKEKSGHEEALQELAAVKREFEALKQRRRGQAEVMWRLRALHRQAAPDEASTNGSGRPGNRADAHATENLPLA